MPVARRVGGLAGQAHKFIQRSLSATRRMHDRIELWKTWDEIPPYKLPGTSKTLQGYSVAGLRTNFYIQPDLMLDAGLSAPFQPRIILVTHGHGDHIANLPFHLIRPKGDEARNVQVYCPKEIVSFIEAYVMSMFQLSDASADVKPIGYTIIGVDESTPPVQVMIQNQPHQISFHKCVHTVPCIGYGISLIKRKLKAEYANLSSEEIKKLKMTDRSLDLSEPRIEPQVFFAGDTTHELFERDPRVLEFPNIIVECTYLEDSDLERAEEKKHMLWRNLLPYIRSYTGTQWILSHFSQKYTKRFIEDKLSNEGLSNLKLWVNVK